jgi:uncharacterized protein YdeI (YjbR/CyaY-like superfamily)
MDVENTPTVFVETSEALNTWLVDNHKSKKSVWLVRWKKTAGKPYLSYADLVAELLCYGWVDSSPKKLDDEKTMVLISPRQAKSSWSAINKQHVAQLLAAGKMQPTGLAAVALAKSNGAWDFLNEEDQLVVPDDLQQALKGVTKAAANFKRFPPASKKDILEWIKNAKKKGIRLKRISETVRKAAENHMANHPKGKDAGPRK